MAPTSSSSSSSSSVRKGDESSSTWTVFLWTSTGTPLLHWERTGRRRGGAERNYSYDQKEKEAADGGRAAGSNCDGVAVYDTARLGELACLMLKLGESSSPGRSESVPHSSSTKIRLRGGESPDSTRVLTVLKRTIPFPFKVVDDCSEGEETHLSVIVGVARTTITTHEDGEHRNQTEEKEEEAVRYLCASWIAELCLPYFDTRADRNAMTDNDRNINLSLTVRNAILFFARQDLQTKNESNFNVKNILKERDGCDSNQRDPPSTTTSRIPEESNNNDGDNAVDYRMADFIVAPEFSPFVRRQQNTTTSSASSNSGSMSDMCLLEEMTCLVEDALFSRRYNDLRTFSFVVHSETRLVSSLSVANTTTSSSRVPLPLRQQIESIDRCVCILCKEQEERDREVDRRVELQPIARLALEWCVHQQRDNVTLTTSSSVSATSGSSYLEIRPLQCLVRGCSYSNGESCCGICGQEGKENDTKEELWRPLVSVQFYRPAFSGFSFGETSFSSSQHLVIGVVQLQSSSTQVDTDAGREESKELEKALLEAFSL